MMIFAASLCHLDCNSAINRIARTAIGKKLIKGKSGSSRTRREIDLGSADPAYTKCRAGDYRDPGIGQEFLDYLLRGGIAMSVLVTGAAGFVGSNLVDRLLQLGETVVGIDAFTDYYSPSLKLISHLPPLAIRGFRCLRKTSLRQILRSCSATVRQFSISLRSRECEEVGV